MPASLITDMSHLNGNMYNGPQQLASEFARVTLSDTSSPDTLNRGPVYNEFTTASSVFNSIRLDSLPPETQALNGTSVWTPVNGMGMDDSLRQGQNTTKCVPVPSSEHVAEIVGRQGCKIKALRAKTNTYIRTPVRGEASVFVVTGRLEDVMQAKEEIMSAAEHFSQIRAQRRLNGVNPGPPSPSTPGQMTIQVRVPYRVVGLVVGPKGATIKRIQQMTQTYIVTPSREKEPIFEVTGLPDNVDNAKQEIEGHIAMRTGTSSDGSNDESDDFLSNGYDTVWKAPITEDQFLQRKSSLEMSHGSGSSAYSSMGSGGDSLANSNGLINDNFFPSVAASLGQNTMLPTIHISQPYDAFLNNPVWSTATDSFSLFSNGFVPRRSGSLGSANSSQVVPAPMLPSYELPSPLRRFGSAPIHNDNVNMNNNNNMVQQAPHQPVYSVLSNV